MVTEPMLLMPLFSWNDEKPSCIPDAIYQVEQILKTLNGKQIEIPVYKLLLGADILFGFFIVAHD
ncbi:hypothetical protein [Anoxybacillus thermarum]|uniref:hypothetical protein n=1 Tax=Anoxybacillus thermarum TaxID=404937 RepID=UPI0005C525C1|nr:hypothetical protein [Anoxybacillus thermarum]